MNDTEVKDAGLDWERLDSLLARSQGLILVTGPDASGKTTTLYFFLHRIQARGRRVVSLGEPLTDSVPVIEGITRVAAGGSAAQTAAEGLRSVMGQGADVLGVEDIPDAATADLLLQASRDGQLVLGVMEARNATDSVSRLMELGVDPVQLAGTLAGVVSQRLARKVCPDCAVPAVLNEALLRQLEVRMEETRDWTPRRGNGCEKCEGSGLRGRAAIHEILEMSPALESAILTRASSSEVRAAAAPRGFRTLRDDAVRKVAVGLIPLEEAVGAVSED